MARKRQTNQFEDFHFVVDDWARGYGFEINRHKWEFQPYHHAERDQILIAGRLRSRTKRKIVAGEAHILPSYLPREDSDEGPERIGSVWLRKGRLYCSAFITSDAYFSLPSCLAIGMFKEMRWRVKDLRYGKGLMDGLELSRNYGELEGSERDYGSEEPVKVLQDY